MSGPAAAALLELDDITVEFQTDSGIIPAVNGASYTVHAGETLGVVGESGSGKSVAVMAALGLLPASATVTRGHAWFSGRDLLAMGQRSLRRIRGAEIGLVLQDPAAALNPLMPIGKQIAEGVRGPDHRVSKRAAWARVVELLAEVGIPDPAIRARQYPHELSGGMRQRVLIAIAMANRPRLMIADEPTTALDVTVQAQILALIRRVQDETGAALVLITHDLGIIAETVGSVAVMYAGRVVETGPVDAIFHRCRHPYTRGLLASLPRLDERVDALRVIGGQPPTPGKMPPGCAFLPRCALSGGRIECRADPALTLVGDGHASACHFAHELALPDGLPQ